MVPLNTQKQQELFEEFVIREKRRGRFFGAFRFKKPVFPQQRISLFVSYETLIIILIGVVLVASIVFSLGVERGRSLKFPDMNAGLSDVPPSAESYTPVVPATESSTVEKPFIDKKAATQKKQPVMPGPEQVVIEAAATPSNERFFTIQVASYKTQDMAERELLRLKNKGYSTDILKKGEYFVLCVGNYIKKETAQKKMAELKQVYRDCLIRKK